MFMKIARYLPCLESKVVFPNFQSTDSQSIARLKQELIRATGTPITGITWQASEKVQLVGCPLKCYLTFNIIFNFNIHFMLLFEIHGIPWIYKVPKNGHDFLPAPNPERSQASRPLPATC